MAHRITHDNCDVHYVAWTCSGWLLYLSPSYTPCSELPRCIHMQCNTDSYNTQKQCTYPMLWFCCHYTMLDDYRFPSHPHPLNLIEKSGGTSVTMDLTKTFWSAPGWSLAFRLRFLSILAPAQHHACVHAIELNNTWHEDNMHDRMTRDIMHDMTWYNMTWRVTMTKMTWHDIMTHDIMHDRMTRDSMYNIMTHDIMHDRMTRDSMYNHYDMTW